MTCSLCNGPRRPGDRNACRGFCGACYRKLRAAGLLPSRERAVRPVYPAQVAATLAAGRSTLQRQARKLGVTTAELKRVLYGGGEQP